MVAETPASPSETANAKQASAASVGCTDGSLVLQARAVKSLEEKVSFKDFDKNAFHILISRAQALALEKSRGMVPEPSKQLALMNQQRGKKKMDSARHGLTFLCSLFYRIAFEFGT